MDELHQELLEHADGQPASARLTLALEHSAQLRAELEQARRQSALLKSRLAPWRLAPDRTRQLAKEISDQLPGRMHLLWRTGIAAAVAACMVVAVGGIYMLFGADPAPQPIPVAREEHAPIWRVERFTPSNVAEVLHREQTLKSGEALELGAQEYATIIDPGTGASCLALPGSRLTANGALKLERGSVEARSGAPISAAGKSYQSQAAFLISVSGASTQLDVYNGNVTQSENGNSRALDKGRHIEGSSHHFAGVEAQAAYARGFEAWHARNWSTARMQLEIASQSDKIGAPLRSIAHFYWFAAAGCEGDKAAAVDIGESFLKRYPQDIHLDYIRYFTGEYLRDMGQLEAAQAQFEIVAKGPAGPLRELARSRLDELAGHAKTKPAALWQEFFAAWQERDYARGETLLRRLIEDYPTDAGVQSGDAQFRLFGCVGNLGRLEDAVREADLLLVTHNSFHANDYALYFKAYYLFQLKRPQEALATLNQLQNRYPDSSMRSFAEDLRKEINK